ncbi:putative RING-H2 finger protein ATL50 [Punica granatum]|uniref:RING-type E3 ubiquitin transferase n=2 Tax=Punica granatum TaxID=22663 RepID=A0A218VYU7_PUNGR|nr:putative RING-H2 finger protein ATL50 [Punica granatum]OWM65388.1 hypothetical protein CDL15_Pgr008978 [Punica granatum]PKI56963.1 hypothetical protein CRG98_022637 [Punica granatum]
MAEEIVLSVVLLILGIAVFVVIHICIVRRLFRPDYHSGVLDSDSSSGRRLGSPTPKMSSQDLSRLPCFDHMDMGEGGRGGINGNNADCAVCLESFKGSEKCRLLPDCGHYFHAQCIDSWLLKTPICPICRASIHSPGVTNSSAEEGDVRSDVIVES